MGEHAIRRAGIAVVAAANAVTAVAVAAYLLCAAVAIVAPDLLVGFFQPWLHGLGLIRFGLLGPGSSSVTS